MAAGDNEDIATHEEVGEADGKPHEQEDSEDNDADSDYEDEGKCKKNKRRARSRKTLVHTNSTTQPSKIQHGHANFAGVTDARRAGT